VRDSPSQSEARYFYFFRQAIDTLWHKTFWDNLGASVELHSVVKVIAVNHRDCGAAKIAYGKEKLSTREGETETHRAAMAEFRTQMREKTYLMSLDGKMETVA